MVEEVCSKALRGVFVVGRMIPKGTHIFFLYSPLKVTGTLRRLGTRSHTTVMYLWAADQLLGYLRLGRLKWGWGNRR